MFYTYLSAVVGSLKEKKKLDTKYKSLSVVEIFFTSSFHSADFKVDKLHGIISLWSSVKLLEEHKTPF